MAISTYYRSEGLLDAASMARLYDVRLRRLWVQIPLCAVTFPHFLCWKDSRGDAGRTT